LSQTVKGRILKGIGASSFGQVVNLVIQLVSVPVFLSVWGVDKYGEWLVLSSLAAYLSMSDVGFATAAANEMAMKVGAGDRQEAVAIYQSVTALLLGLGAVLLMISAGVIWSTPAVGWLPIDRISPVEAAIVLSILVVNIVVGQQHAILHAGFRCDGQFARGQWIFSWIRLLEFLAQVAVAWRTKSVVLVAGASLGIKIVALVGVLGVLRFTVPWLTQGFHHVERSQLRRLFAPAVASLGFPLGHAISLQGLLQVVAWKLGPQAAAIFSIHRTVANLVTQISNTIALSIWPECSLAVGAKNFALARVIHLKACRWSLGLSLCASIGIPVVAPVVIPWWTVGQIHCDVVLMITLALSVLVRACWWISSIVPLSMNRHASLVRTYLAVGLSNLVLAAILCPFLGVRAAGLAALGIDVVMALIVMPSTLRLIGDEFAPFIKSLLKPSALWSSKPTQIL
jgi:O-antigen/teichoic acid export membrane protein